MFMLLSHDVILLNHVPSSVSRLWMLKDVNTVYLGATSSVFIGRGCVFFVGDDEQCTESAWQIVLCIKIIMSVVHNIGNV